METANKLTYLSTKFFTENKEEYRITVTVSLNDDCHNNMCDWSITADIRRKNKCGMYGEYMGGCCHNEVAKHFPELAKFISLHLDCHNNMCDWSITADIRRKNKCGMYGEYMGGCCHNEVAKHFPELAKFISLHLCNHYGAPMYPVENGTYHIKNSDKSVAIEYLRISDKERSLVEERIKSGYYSAENIEKRKIEAHKADVAGKRFNICEYYNQKIREAETNKKIMLCGR